MKKTLLILLAGILMVSAGCFKVDRNNPYDPDSDLPASEKSVKLFGTVYRGWSDQTLGGVKIQIGGNTVTSDSKGKYEMSLLPGNYTVAASKDGWMQTKYDLEVRASRYQFQQQEDIGMYIFYEYWEEYSPISEVKFPPWTFTKNDSPTSSCVATGQVIKLNAEDNALFISLNNPAVPIVAYSGVSAYFSSETPVVNHISIGMTFNAFFTSETQEGFEIFDCNGLGRILEIGMKYDNTSYWDYVLYYTPRWTTPNIFDSQFNEWDQFRVFDISLDDSRKNIILEIYNQSGGSVYWQVIPVSDIAEDPVTSLDGLNFYISTKNGMMSSPVEGGITVHWVEFY